MNILAIETSVLPPLDSYLDRDNNIPPEDGDHPPPPPPVEIDPIWHQGASWPYVPDAPCGNDGDDSQPPSLPPSPGLSYRTPRTPSLRHRSVTPSCHSSGDSHSGSTQNHPSLGSTHSRSQMLTEQFSSFPCEREIPVPVRPVTPRTYDTGFDPAMENARVFARRQALETPTAPHFGAIPDITIASYPQEWHDGAHSGKYCTIPSYMEWRLGVQPELTQLPVPAGRPPSLVPGPSAWTDHIEQPVFEGP